MYKSSDIFSFGLIILKSLFNLKEKYIYDINIIDKGEELID